jgi:L-ascorbate metabolism protein UlaG (beta-lactamase superfamily)
MLLTKYTHACIRLEKDGHALVIDPGSFSELEVALKGAATVLITHEHEDHVDRERLPGILSASDGMQVYAPERVAEELRELVPEAAGRIHAAAPQTRFSVSGFEIRTYGGQHALIHPHIPVVDNIGYLIDDNVYHPGDALIVPHRQAVPTLLVPVHGPWSKTAEVIDFLTSVRPARAYPIHDGLLNRNGQGIVEKHLARFGEQYGTRYQHLEPGQSVTV